MHSLLILYGTETGNAQDVAERIGRDAIRHRSRARVIAMEEYSLPDLLDEQVVIFVCSTTGNGQEPRSMTNLWNALLRSDLPSDLFDSLQFAVFSLGDSSYDRFCWAGKKLHRRMLGLGATELVERGDADEQHYLGIDGTLNPWIDSLFNALLELFPLSLGIAILPPTVLLPPRAHIHVSSETTNGASTSYAIHLFIPPNTRPARLQRNERITRSDWFQDVRHIEFEFDDDIRHKPGDVAILYPSNSDEEVVQLLDRLEWRDIADKALGITPVDSDQPLPHNLPSHSTLRALLTSHLDFTAIPRRSFFEYLRHFATDERERERLEEFTSAEGQEDLYAYCNRPRRTILEVLLEFRSVKIPLQYLLDVFSTIRPRQFSIANSALTYPREVQLCVAIVRYKSQLRAPRKGLCTSWLARLPIDTTVHIGIESGTMTLPYDDSQPIIAIGPGTGIAPMRAFLQERIKRGCKENILYFGCRSLSADYYYRDEWKAYGESLEVRVACSRDQDHKVYVQDLIKADSSKIKDWILNRGAYVYISGSSNQMPAGVRKAFVGALVSEEGCTEEAAKQYIDTMESQGRWSEECWS